MTAFGCIVAGAGPLEAAIRVAPSSCRDPEPDDVPQPVCGRPVFAHSIDDVLPVRPALHQAGSQE
jgi:hypothetical protein